MEDKIESEVAQKFPYRFGKLRIKKIFFVATSGLLLLTQIISLAVIAILYSRNIDANDRFDKLDESMNTLEAERYKLQKQYSSLLEDYSRLTGNVSNTDPDDVQDPTQNDDDYQLTYVDITVEYLNNPIVSEYIDIISPADTKDDYFEDRNVFYKIGVVTKFEYDDVNYSGYEYYILGSKELTFTATYMNAGVELLKDPSSDNYVLLILGIPYSYPGEFKMNDNIKDLTLDTEFSFRRNRYSELNWEAKGDTYELYQEDFVAKNGSLLRYDSTIYFPFEEAGFKTVVTTLNGNNVYSYDDDGFNGFYMRSEENFIDVVVVQPDIVEENNEQSVNVNIDWADGTKNESYYEFRSTGTCTFTNYIAIEDIDMSELKQTGTASNGDPIYEMKNNDTQFLKDLYQQDYIETDLNTYNISTEDDEKPFTYEQFLTKHPVFYWQDDFGRFVKFVSTEYMFVGGCGKPAVYLYPEQNMDLSLEVIPNGKLTFTYPEYNDIWNVTASPDGTILNHADNITVDYLWWESQSNGFKIPDEGFILDKDSLDSQLTTILGNAGLNDKETSQFLEYWMIRMLREDTQKYFVTFLVDNQVNSIAKLKYSVQPDSELRLFMLYKPVDDDATANELKFNKFERKGFTSVEWGGGRID